MDAIGAPLPLWQVVEDRAQERIFERDAEEAGDVPVPQDEQGHRGDTPACARKGRHPRVVGWTDSCVFWLVEGARSCTGVWVCHEQTPMHVGHTHVLSR